MNKERFVIIDDDPGICYMLQNIIEDHDLGEVVELINDGLTGIDLIPKFRPDIVFVDLLLPDIDGIEIVKQLKKQNLDTDFIMISQVSDNEMISEAYESGIEFYINKPINVIEVISVTKRVVASQRNRRVLKQIGNTLNQTNTSQTSGSDLREKAEVIFAELGVLSEKGSGDLIEMVLYVAEHGTNYQIGDLYRYVHDHYRTSGMGKPPSIKAIEQRIRRTISSALTNIAHLGIEDFGNYKFDRYSQLFGYQEVKKVMDNIRNKQVKKPTINSKLFINGISNYIK